jgi:oligogalacturonide lyase
LEEDKLKRDQVYHHIVKHRDSFQGKTIRQLTSEPGNHHHLYFTSNSFTLDNQSIIYISETQSDGPNLFKLNINSGEARQLTENSGGYLKSYVYYDGHYERGLGKASISYNPITNQLLYIQDRNIVLLEVDTFQEKIIYELPQAVITGFTHLSSDGRYACIPYISAEAFNVDENNSFVHIREKVKKEKILSHVLVVDTHTNQGKVWFTHSGWITHVQFHPFNPRKILFNHEGGKVDQRIWLYDDGEIYKIRNEDIEIRPIWVCHEVWTNQGDGIIYHGRKFNHDNQEVQFVGQVSLENKERFTELAFPESMQDYGHFTLNPNNQMLVTDGIINSKWLHICHAKWGENKLSWHPLCKHGSSFAVQDVHPHPIFSHDGKSVLFTSDLHNDTGKGHIYIVDNERE